MALISMAVHDTIENGRTELTQKTLNQLEKVKGDHRLTVVDNGSCEETKELLLQYHECGLISHIITITENIGTAKAINAAWGLRKPNEHLCKIDNDIYVHTPNCFDILEDAIERLPAVIGIACAKRKDLWWSPNATGWAKSELQMLPQEKGQRNIVAEYANDTIGSLQMYNHRLIEKIGGLTQFGLYGYDDSLASVRCEVAGFKHCFIHGIEIDHMDVSGDDGGYAKWKQGYAGERTALFYETKRKLINKEIPLYEPI